MNNKTIALLVAGFCAVGITCAGIAIAILLWTQHSMVRQDRPTEVAATVANPPDQIVNPRPNGQPRADSRPGDRGNFQRRGGGGMMTKESGSPPVALNLLCVTKDHLELP